ncbi:hypothetical protein DFJ75_4007 [Williamsia muralis]|uniref:Uncharacterized protein n=2 Tax=Williamsia marianensis TaxID=85044 RepID=A0A495K9V8_WILMA|nr:hypothetical protein [Williamsia muralis]RKR97142.1 hypothetical protein DFJ75_4007 [Williamsia muralis]
MTGGNASSLRTRLMHAEKPYSGRFRRPLFDRPAPLTRREVLSLTRERTQNPLTNMRELAWTSPGKLMIISLVLLISSVVVGWYSSDTLDDRTTTLENMIVQTEPLAEASQVLYSSLSIADAAANSAFISGGLEPPELRERYNDAVATAAHALIQSVSGAAMDNTEIRQDLTTLSAQIPVYTGLIESARINNRLGNPVGSAYLGEASNMMQEMILPAAERLYAERADAIGDSRTNFTNAPWGVYTALMLLLAAMIAAHLYVAKRSRRRFNLGLLVGIGCVLIGLLWLLVGGLLSVNSTANAENRGAVPLRELTQARILTQQARSDETLSLVRRGDQQELESGYATAVAQIDTVLTDYREDDRKDVAEDSVSDAIDALALWRDAHAAILERTNAGDFNGATAIAVGDNPDGSAAAYSRLDTALVDGITDTRNTFRDDINTARVVIGYAGLGIMLLGIAAGIAAFVGIFPRIREYR